MDESIQKQLDQLDRLRITKLSEAIRVGARIRPQCTGQAFKDGASCAMGAAYEARTGLTCAYNSPHMAVVLPELFDSDMEYSDLGNMVTRWNDRGIPREAIADKLEEMGY